MFSTISEVKEANASIGHHSTLYAGRYFITSERYDENSPRRYSVRFVHDDGAVDTFGDFQQYRTLEDARDACREQATFYRRSAARA